MKYDPNLVAPPEVVRAVQTIREFAVKHTAGNEWQIGGLMPVECGIGYYKAKMEDAQRQLNECKALLAEGRNLMVESIAEDADLQRQLAECKASLADARAVISYVEHSEDTLPKGARYAIESYRKEHPEC